MTMAYLHGAALVKAARKMKGQHKYVGLCQSFAILTSRTGSSTPDWDHDGDHDAVDWWKHARDKGHVVGHSHIKHYDDIPAGTLLYWSGGSHGYGHAAISAGNGRTVSTDAPTYGRIGEVPIEWIHQHWGHTFLGYIVNDGFGHQMVPATKKKDWFDMADAKDLQHNTMYLDKVPSPMFKDNKTVTPITALSYSMQWSLTGRNAAQQAAKDSASALEIVKAMAAKGGTSLTADEIENAAERGAAKAIDDRIEEADVNLIVNAPEEK